MYNSIILAAETKHHSWREEDAEPKDTLDSPGDGAHGISIGETARYIGVSTQALRGWENEGLIKPRRSQGGTRYYSRQDLERLRGIQQLREIHGLNFAAIRRELGSVEDNGSAEEPQSELQARRLGERLRSVRLGESKTLKQVSEATGLSVSFISALERGHSGASIATLRNVLGFYGLHWREVFGDPVEHRSRLVGPQDRPLTRWPNGLRSEGLTTTGSLMDPAVMHFPPNTGSGEHFSHSGEEFIYVLSGRLFVELDEPGRETKVYRLGSEDCLYFPSSVPHTWWTEEEQATVIYVDSPPSF
ncbi:MerR family transcriptional regulator [Rubrobacter aplysinae]|uniref:MerR family transcriptional regulator n=1 Tax=Rubrobacter aplysinae TaxID=909625 RepID=UPI001F3B15B4|nr:MerR family transcriptional regulator [Rubrobacter aplysinae]